jgi:hypothetical protein
MFSGMCRRELFNDKANERMSFSELVKRIEQKRLVKSFGQLLYLAAISQSESHRQLCSIKSCGYQERNVFMLTNLPDLGETKGVDR